MDRQSVIYPILVLVLRKSTYKIIQLLPPEGGDFQYRIKSADEAHERVAKESQLDRST